MDFNIYVDQPDIFFMQYDKPFMLYDRIELHSDKTFVLSNISVMHYEITGMNSSNTS